MTVRNPNTPAEWQATVDAADFMLSLDAARKYGLVAGGPEVNVQRCEDILQRGAEAGYRPRPDDLEPA